MDLTSLLNKIGIESEQWILFINETAVILIVGIIGYLAYIIAKKWLAKLVIKITGKTSYQWDNLMFTPKFFSRLGLLIAPITVLTALSTIGWMHTGILSKFTHVWLTITAVMMVSVIAEGANRIYESYPISKDKPIKVFVQIILIFLWCAAVMVIISIFTGKSVTILLGGLTAFAAVLMLIFQDSILGFVASIQLNANNMVSVGDWIVMPSRGVDGDVIEINLTTVKVQNWDKTITTIPTHKLVAESFTNWRGMDESGGRRIKRSISIDIATIHYLSSEEIESLRNSSLLKTYMEGKIKELEEFNTSRSANIDKRRLTNIGIFREYLESWIASNPNINQNMTHMVRQLQPGPTGVPLEIYCFSALQGWIDYERVQSDIFDHVFAVLDLFSLRAFQYSGSIVPTSHS